MKILRIVATAFSLIALFALAAPSAMADEWNKETVVTISGPIEVPGVGQHILPAGTYVFKLLDSQSDRHIVQIFNQDKTHIFTTILAIPNFRLKATDKTVITFRERPAGEPEALRAWFYPGREWGEEFVYAKPRAVQLAKETNEPVLATPVELESAPIEVLNTAPVVAVAPTGEPVELAQVVQTPPADAKAAPVTMAAAALPKTASSLALIGLIGVLGLGGCFVLLFVSKRTA
jgi:hypothetical protein